MGPQDSEGGRADLPASSVRSVWAGGEVTGVTPLSLSPNNLHLRLSSTAQLRTGLVWSGHLHQPSDSSQSWLTLYFVQVMEMLDVMEEEVESLREMSRYHSVAVSVTLHL